MYAIATFTIVALISMLLVRFATGGLVATGLPPEVASFQAQSAYTGVGFTTVETENVVNHPLRRRIIAVIMMVGSLGTPTLVVTLLLGFIVPGPGDTIDRLLGTITALVLVLLLVASPPVTRWFVEVGRRYAHRRLKPAIDNDYRELLQLGDDFVVAEVEFAKDPQRPLRSLRELNQALAEVTLLGIRRQNGEAARYLGESPTDVELEAGDALVIYGRRDRLARIVEAPTGYGADHSQTASKRKRNTTGNI